jgi:hypothetical protein
MTNVTFSIANAFMKLRAPDMAPVVEFLRAEQQDAMAKMMDAGEEHQWRRLQGRAKLASELLDLVEKSAEIAAKLNAPR